MRDLFTRAMWRAETEFKSRTRRPFTRTLSPFVDRNDAPVLIHCCYHKVGTVWFGRILRHLAAEYGMRYGEGEDYDGIHRFETQADSDVFIDYGSHVDLAALPRRYRASHMIRDPRDLVVSGYFYHRWTEEPWANLPLAEYRGMSYRQYLNSIPKSEGLLEEIRRNAFWISHMASWKFAGPRVFEIRYEDIIEDEEPVFRAMFAHYEFRPDVIERAVAITRRYSFETIKAKGGSGEKSHLRSGRSGEWREHFEPAHVELFKALYPGAVTRLGYEAGGDW
jgi:hypothetical protein